MDNVHLLHKTSLSRLGEAAALSNVHKPIQRAKEHKEQENMHQIKEKDKSPETDLNETDYSTET